MKITAEDKRKIMQELADMYNIAKKPPEDSFTSEEFAIEIGMSKASARRFLATLMKDKIVERIVFGNRVFYRKCN